MWGLLLVPPAVCLLLMLAAAAVKLWPAKPEQVWEFGCHECGWGGTLSGPVVDEHVARMLAGSHSDRTGHLVEVRTEL